MTDPQPSCSTYKCVNDETLHYMGSRCNNGYVMEVCITCGKIFKLVSAPELEAKQKTIEELQAKLESCEMLSGSTMGSICCQYHRAEALEKEAKSLRAEVERLKKP